MILLLLSSLLSGVVALLSLFGVRWLPFEFTYALTFNTVGTPSSLVIYLSAVTILANALWVSDRKTSTLLPDAGWRRWSFLGLSLLLSLLTLFLAVALDYQTVWVVLLAGL